MELTIKHLAPYLPYEVRCKFNLLIIDYFVLNTKNLQQVIDKDYIMPILRPLSDLNDNVIDYMWFEILGVDNEFLNYDQFTEYCELGSNCELGSISLLPIMVYNFLLKEHFDVFGLIESGLAIDINTLNK